MMKLPDFICLGAQKAGTTTLHEILRQHPDIFMPEDKEARFFDLDTEYEKGLDHWYNKHFSNYSNEKIAGVVSPDYLFYEKVPNRIFNDLGTNVKFIVILRNPADRAYSQYLMSKRRGFDPLSFDKAIEVEKERISTGIEEEFNVYSYISRGFYSEQINRYLKLFPKHQFLFLSFEKDIKLNLSETVDRILDFIEVRHLPLKKDITSNKATGVRSMFLQKITRNNYLVKRILKNLIPKKLRRRLRKRVIDYNESKPIANTGLSADKRRALMHKYFLREPEELKTLTGIDFSYWIDSSND